MYKIPKEYYQRIHHIRPRFKNDIENVLLFISNEIANLPFLPKDKFKTRLNNAIRFYPGNQSKTNKTINNWRTEISSLFGLIIFEKKEEQIYCRPSQIANELAERQDLVEFFKFFLFSFQYPGGHLKKHVIENMLKNGIRFKPAIYILDLLHHTYEEGNTFGINKAEATHCIFNDLRVTRDHRDVEKTKELIIENRKKEVEYDWSGDVIRYAGDILDYMEIANLVHCEGQKYYLNKHAMDAILYFINESEYCEDIFQSSKKDTDYKLRYVWFNYLEELRNEINFKTELTSFIDENRLRDYKEMQPVEEESLKYFREKIVERDGVKTKEIGDMGESLVIGHEKMKLKNVGNIQLIKKVKKIPDHLGLGFDIRSYKLNENIKKIEVKTTISKKAIKFLTFHMTENEWNVADQEGDNYYIYRLMISDNGTRLIEIKNPVEKYKKNVLDMKLHNGPKVYINDEVGKEVELLLWKD